MSEKCAYCQKSDALLHRDHVVPRSRGGPDNATNIVMACPQCNSSKRDRLASEWLGEECPDRVRAIEDRVNKQLANRFKKRDWKKCREPKGLGKSSLCVCRITDDGHIDYSGEVLEEYDTYWRVQLLDGVSSFFGLWMLSDEIRDLEKTQCRIFSDPGACLSEIHRLNRDIGTSRGARSFRIAPA